MQWEKIGSPWEPGQHPRKSHPVKRSRRSQEFFLHPPNFHQVTSRPPPQNSAQTQGLGMARPSQLWNADCRDRRSLWSWVSGPPHLCPVQKYQKPQAEPSRETDFPSIVCPVLSNQPLMGPASPLLKHFPWLPTAFQTIVKTITMAFHQPFCLICSSFHLITTLKSPNLAVPHSPGFSKGLTVSIPPDHLHMLRPLPRIPFASSFPLKSSYSPSLWMVPSQWNWPGVGFLPLCPHLVYTTVDLCHHPWRPGTSHLKEPLGIIQS